MAGLLLLAPFSTAHGEVVSSTSWEWVRDARGNHLYRTATIVWQGQSVMVEATSVRLWFPSGVSASRLEEAARLYPLRRVAVDSATSCLAILDGDGTVEEALRIYARESDLTVSPNAMLATPVHGSGSAWASRTMPEYLELGTPPCLRVAGHRVSWLRWQGKRVAVEAGIIGFQIKDGVDILHVVEAMRSRGLISWNADYGRRGGALYFAPTADLSELIGIVSGLPEISLAGPSFPVTYR